MGDGSGAREHAFGADADFEGVAGLQRECGVEGDGGFDFELIDGDDAEDRARSLDEFAGLDEDAFDDGIDGRGEVVAGAPCLGEREFEFGLVALLARELEPEFGLIDFELGALDLELGDGALGDGLLASSEFVAGESEGRIGGADVQIALGADAREGDLGIDLGGVDAREGLARGDALALTDEHLGDEAIDHKAEGAILDGADDGVDEEFAGLVRGACRELRDAPHREGDEQEQAGEDALHVSGHAMLILDMMTRIDGRSLAAWRAMAEMARPRARTPKGLDALWHDAAGVLVRFRRSTRGYLERGKKVLAHGEALRALTDRALDERIAEARGMQHARRRGEVDEAWTLAVVREAARREIGLEAHGVQVSAACALLDGCVAELATGEGKTLVAALAGVVRGWRRGPVHLVTANDYLAGRDAAWMGPVFARAGLRVGCVVQETGLEERREAYRRDVVYTTSKEVAADFLRDRLTLGHPPGLAQAIVRRMGRSGHHEPIVPGLHCAIVDEADAVLIDEAVTPLILSAQTENPEHEEGVLACAAFIGALERDRAYVVDEQEREVRLTNAGRRGVASWDGGGCGVLKGQRRREEMVVQALTARWLYERDRHYAVDEHGKIVIIDDRTGRLLPDRTWRHGMQQAIEAKESVPLTGEKETLARISFQRFFGLYGSLSGMTGTARESSREFWRMYRMPVAKIPTNRPVRRVRERSLYLHDLDAKYEAVIRAIQDATVAGRAVLVGTRFVRESEQLSERLRERGIEHAVLNAIRHEQEAEIIARAGKSRSVTIATNMAGRGTDIVLDDRAWEAGGLHVIVTERNPTARIDRQLFGRAGRQGDPGSCRMILCGEDPLLAGVWKWSWGALHAVGMGWLAFAGAQGGESRRDRRRRASVLRADTWLDESVGFAGPSV